MRTFLTCLALITIGTLGCSGVVAGNASPGADAGPSGPSIADFCATTAHDTDPWCDYEARCCSAADKSDPDYTAVLCIPVADRTNDSCLTPFTDLIAKGNVVYHPEHAQGCLDALRARVPAPPATCSGMRAFDVVSTFHRVVDLAQLPACRAAFEGTLQAGAACAYSTDCAWPNRCQNVDAPKSSLDFRCAPVRHRGDPCSLDNECSDDDQCSGRVDATTCSPPRLAGDACRADGDCAAGLACDLTLSVSVCVQPLAVGAACGGEGQTIECAGTATCSRWPGNCVDRLDDGQACTDSAECKGRCDATTKTCVSICGGTK